MKLIYKWNHHEPIGDTEFYFNVDSDGKCTICFNGSELPQDSLKDWVYNFAAWLTIRNEYGFYFDVHYGLYRKWLLVSNMILELIYDNYLKIKTIEISGYSQGGALAIFLHRWLKLKSIKNIKTVVAGVPKLFGSIGSCKNKELCKDIIVLRYKNDIVSKIVPWYFNVGQIKQTGSRNPFIWSVNDHLLKNNDYLKRIENY